MAEGRVLIADSLAEVADWIGAERATLEAVVQIVTILSVLTVMTRISETQSIPESHWRPPAIASRGARVWTAASAASALTTRREW